MLRLLHELDFARYVTGRVLARSALALLCGTEPEAVRRTRCPGCGGAHGKPQALGGAARWELSLMHSGDVVAVAVTQGFPVGLDVERLDDPPEPPPEAGLPPEYELVLTAEERAAVIPLPRAERAAAFMTYWTCKEAALKATGEGLTANS
ncbi:4'-phosphopantetheinyl transferase family protein [Streptomyces sp. NPDC088725]|uniref:4'-phosphopantetheinyl transferase family protein n=1 Tax=Streptomyces sp. NPDC088725 TaxID=3365873 RepID=UPI0038102414